MGAPAATEATWHRRYDRGELLASVERADGTLLLEGYAARPGVLVYRNADGTSRLERVTADTLRKSAAGLARSAVTLEHPGENVTPDNVARYGVGDVDGEVVIEDTGFIRVKMAVRRRDAVNAVKSRKKRELSPGYDVSLDETPGVDPELGAYDATQIERRYNHLAIVGVARGGPQVRLRADSGDAVATTSIPISNAGDPAPQPQRGAGMMNSRLITLLASLGVSQRVDSDDAAIDAAIDKLKERQDAASKAAQDATQVLTLVTTERDDLRTKLAAAERERESHRARADAAESERDTLRASDEKRRDAAERESLEQVASALGLEASKHPVLGDLKRAVARAHLGAELRADATDAYVDALVDLAREGQKTQTRQAAARVWDNAGRRDTREQAAPEPDHEAASWKRWSGPTTNTN